jgi:hypothetical protein
MDKLTKLSLLTVILGILILYILFIQNFFVLEGINNMTSQNKDKEIYLEGEIIHYYENNHSTSILMKTECYVNGIIYDKTNFNEKLKTKDVKIKGTVAQEFNPKINIEEIYALN